MRQKNKDLIVKNRRKKKLQLKPFFSGPGRELKSLFEESNVQTPCGSIYTVLLVCLLVG